MMMMMMMLLAALLLLSCGARRPWARVGSSSSL
jgi:hypothetical protein